MTTSAPQWPGQGGMQEGCEADGVPARPTLVRDLTRAQATASRTGDGDALDRRRVPLPGDGRATAAGGDQAIPGDALSEKPTGAAPADDRPALRVVPDVGQLRLRPVPDQVAAPARPKRLAPGRRSRLVVVRDPMERDVWAARRRARANLPPPAAVTRDIALALLEVEAGCRSATQLERIFSPELWEALEHRIGRRGGPLPSGRSLIAVRCQEDAPGLADTVAVVQKGDLVRPVALRLDASRGRWTVTELRWWRNETDTAATPGRDGGSS
jgi:hypothetical protein